MQEALFTGYLFPVAARSPVARSRVNTLTRFVKLFRYDKVIATGRDGKVASLFSAERGAHRKLQATRGFNSINEQLLLRTAVAGVQKTSALIDDDFAGAIFKVSWWIGSDVSFRRSSGLVSRANPETRRRGMARLGRWDEDGHPSTSDGR